jgi:hypothetical protein
MGRRIVRQGGRVWVGGGYGIAYGVDAGKGKVEWVGKRAHY